MTSPTGCDGCQSELDLFAVSNRQTGDAQFLGPLCLASFGVATLVVSDEAAADLVLKTFGYAPTAATKRARKEAETPEYDANRVIAAVVESAPTPPADESVSSQDDESVDQLVDKSADGDSGDEPVAADPYGRSIDEIDAEEADEDATPAPPY